MTKAVTGCNSSCFGKSDRKNGLTRQIGLKLAEVNQLMDVIKGNLFLVGLVVAALLIKRFVGRIERNQRQLFDLTQITNLEHIADNVRKSKDNIHQ